MGKFIDEVGKNNQLQKEYLSYKQQQAEIKAKEKRQKQKEIIYKQITKIETKKAINLLHEYIEKEYTISNKYAFDELNKIENRKALIKQVIDDLFIKELFNSDDILFLQHELENKYLTINLKYKRIYEYDLQANYNELKEEGIEEYYKIKENAQIQQRKDTSKRIMAFTGGFIGGLIWGFSRYPKKGRRR